jgi:hypothetical protein
MTRRKSVDVFYEDPNRPGSGAHARCLGKGLNLTSDRYPPHPGPCWKCTLVARLADFSDQHAPDIRSVVDKFVLSLKALSDAARQLHWEIMLEGFLVDIDTNHIEKVCPEQFDSFLQQRKILTDIMIDREWRIGPSEEQYKSNKYLFRYAMRGKSDEHQDAYLLKIRKLLIPPSGPSSIDFSRIVKDDPTLQANMKLDDLIQYAVRLTKGARLFQLQFEQRRELKQLAFGMDAYDEAAFLCTEFGLSQMDVARAWNRIRTDKPVGQSETSSQELDRIDALASRLRQRKHRKA